MSLTQEEYKEIVNVLAGRYYNPAAQMDEMISIITRAKRAAWCEGRDKAADECDGQAGAMESPCEIAASIRSLESPYESQP